VFSRSAARRRQAPLGAPSGKAPEFHSLRSVRGTHTSASEADVMLSAVAIADPSADSSRRPHAAPIQVRPAGACRRVGDKLRVQVPSAPASGPHSVLSTFRQAAAVNYTRTRRCSTKHPQLDTCCRGGRLIDSKDIKNGAGKVTATVLYGEVVAVHVHEAVLDPVSTNEV
jgi:hypothetical protein